MALTSNLSGQGKALESVVAVLCVDTATTTFEAIEWQRVDGHIQATGRWRGKDDLIWRSWPAHRVEIRATSVGSE